MNGSLTRFTKFLSRLKDQRCMSTVPIPTFDAKLRQLTIQLDKLAPRFNLPEGSVKILREPAEFYAVLRHKIRNAERRIFLSTLYIGNAEHELVSHHNAA